MMEKVDISKAQVIHAEQCINKFISFGTKEPVDNSNRENYSNKQVKFRLLIILNEKSYKRELKDIRNNIISSTSCSYTRLIVIPESSPEPQAGWCETTHLKWLVGGKSPTLSETGAKFFDISYVGAKPAKANELTVTGYDEASLLWYDEESKKLLKEMWEKMYLKSNPSPYPFAQRDHSWYVPYQYPQQYVYPSSIKPYLEDVDAYPKLWIDNQTKPLYTTTTTTNKVFEPVAGYVSHITCAADCQVCKSLFTGGLASNFVANRIADDVLVAFTIAASSTIQ